MSTKQTKKRLPGVLKPLSGAAKRRKRAEDDINTLKMAKQAINIFKKINSQQVQIPSVSQSQSQSKHGTSNDVSQQSESPSNSATDAEPESHPDLESMSQSDADPKSKSVSESGLQLTPTSQLDPNSVSESGLQLTPTSQLGQLAVSKPRSHQTSRNQETTESEFQSTPLENPGISSYILKDVHELDRYDPCDWPIAMMDSIRHAIITLGVQQKQLKTYPVRNNAVFKASYFTGLKKNGESYVRDWLMYSESSNRLFCFPCSIFGSSDDRSPWKNYAARIGFHDFRNMSRAIPNHENSQSHYNNVKVWKSYIFNHSNRNTINALKEKDLLTEVSFWKNVLRGILDAIIFLAKHNLAFQGHSSDIRNNDCGNFLGLIKLLSNYYPPLMQHISRLKKKQTSYFSAQIQNEFINLCGKEVRKHIIAKIKERKYFSILFDSTPDSSRMEQVSQVVRTVSCTTEGCRIEEHFIDFITTTQKTGLGLSNVIIQKLESDGLLIVDCRGQGYDNGGNMAGIYKGVQKWIRDQNPLADYVPCAAHTLNLVGVNSAERVLPSKLILGQIQNIFAFFSKSTFRWNKLKGKLSQTLKGQSATRWSSRASAVSALCSQYLDLIECLVEMVTSESEDINAETMAGANSILNDMLNFKFLLSVVIWNSILWKIEISNLTLQSENVSLDIAEKTLNGLLHWLKEFRVKGFVDCKEKANEIAVVCGIDEDSGFTDVRLSRGRKRQRLCEKSSDTEMTNLERFEREFFNGIMDNIISEMSNRFEQIREISSLFGFLWGQKLETLSNSELEKHVKDLCIKYEKDLDMSKFVNEIVFLKDQITPFLPIDKKVSDLKPMDVLNIFHQYELVSAFQNTEIALRIFLTMPVTVASNERAFSKLKIIKNYLRSQMGQERLTNLAILSIEHEITDVLIFDQVISLFATVKCRRVNITK